MNITSKLHPSFYSSNSTETKPIVIPPTPANTPVDEPVERPEPQRITPETIKAALPKQRISNATPLKLNSIDLDPTRYVTNSQKSSRIIKREIEDKPKKVESSFDLMGWMPYLAIGAGLLFLTSAGVPAQQVAQATPMAFGTLKGRVNPFD